MHFNKTLAVVLTALFFGIALLYLSSSPITNRSSDFVAQGWLAYPAYAFVATLVFGGVFTGVACALRHEA
ncbi:MAG TPA: hypothetical protein VMD05_06555 [Candidatus Nanoarchaeia archaeon]|nr:hypothetical protein [Candidatus Nanoarchaeia archaeon]